MPKCQRPVYTETEYGYCRQCDYRFCSGCNQAYHGAAPCGMTDEEMTAHIKRYAAADEAERARLEQETRGRRKLENDASEELIKNIFKKCPSCNASVEVSHFDKLLILSLSMRILGFRKYRDATQCIVQSVKIIFAGFVESRLLQLIHTRISRRHGVSYLQFLRRLGFNLYLIYHLF